MTKAQISPYVEMTKAQISPYVEMTKAQISPYVEMTKAQISPYVEMTKAHLQDDRFEPANELLRMYENFPHGLQTHQGRQQVKNLQNQVAERHDQVLYELFRRYPERDRIERYLNEVPLQTMQTEVLK
jgi:hypothetical protein